MYLPQNFVQPHCWILFNQYLMVKNTQVIKLNSSWAIWCTHFNYKIVLILISVSMAIYLIYLSHKLNHYLSIRSKHSEIRLNFELLLIFCIFWQIMSEIWSQTYLCWRRFCCSPSGPQRSCRLQRSAQAPLALHASVLPISRPDQHGGAEHQQHMHNERDTKRVYQSAAPLAC